MTCVSCDEIQAEINTYEAAINVDQASVSVATAQLNSDEASLGYWQGQTHVCGCGTGAGNLPSGSYLVRPLISPDRAKQIAADIEAVKQKHVAEILKELATGAQ
jgi:hypothetical protein